MDSDAPTLDQLKERVRRDWADVATIEAWRRWREPFSVQTQMLTSTLIDAADIRPGQRVLDLASGAGEPALTLARAVGDDGHVTASDLSPGWLAIIEDAALAESLGNIDLVVADAHALPFPAETFDRVTSRLGVMFFADVQRALAECRRVLRPEGRGTLPGLGRSAAEHVLRVGRAALGSRVELPRSAAGNTASRAVRCAGQPRARARTGGLRRDPRRSG